MLYNMGNALGTITDYDRLQYMRAKLALHEHEKCGHGRCW
jgi:hypothetical protein